MRRCAPVLAALCVPAAFTDANAKAAGAEMVQDKRLLLTAALLRTDVVVDAKMMTVL